jgi:hypothetical protein
MQTGLSKQQVWRTCRASNACASAIGVPGDVADTIANGLQMTATTLENLDADDPTAKADNNVLEPTSGRPGVVWRRPEVREDARTLRRRPAGRVDPGERQHR